MKYKTLDLLKPLQLYVNGVWIDVLPVCKKGSSLYVKNVDFNNKLPLMEYTGVDLFWHFSTAKGLQIRNTSGKVSFKDKITFILRSYM